MGNLSHIFASLYFIYPNTNDTSLYFVSTGLSTMLNSELLNIRGHVLFILRSLVLI